MFEKGSDVKQSNVMETGCGPQCAFLVEKHVQTAREFHFYCLKTVYGLLDNSFKQLNAFFREDLGMKYFYGHSSFSADSRRAVVS